MPTHAAAGRPKVNGEQPYSQKAAKRDRILCASSEEKYKARVSRTAKKRWNHRKREKNVKKKTVQIAACATIMPTEAAARRPKANVEQVDGAKPATTQKHETKRHFRIKNFQELI